MHMKVSKSMKKMKIISYLAKQIKTNKYNYMMIKFSISIHSHAVNETNQTGRKRRRQEEKWITVKRTEFRAERIENM